MDSLVLYLLNFFYDIHLLKFLKSTTVESLVIADVHLKSSTVQHGVAALGASRQT